MSCSTIFPSTGRSVIGRNALAVSGYFSGFWKKIKIPLLNTFGMYAFSSNLSKKCSKYSSKQLSVLANPMEPELKAKYFKNTIFANKLLVTKALFVREWRTCAAHVPQYPKDRAICC